MNKHQTRFSKAFYWLRTQLIIQQSLTQTTHQLVHNVLCFEVSEFQLLLLLLGWPQNKIRDQKILLASERLKTVTAVIKVAVPFSLTQVVITGCPDKVLWGGAINVSCFANKMPFFPSNLLLGERKDSPALDTELLLKNQCCEEKNSLWEM